MRVALVHDWLTGMRGGERCLEAFCEVYPKADIFTLVHVRGAVSSTIEGHRICTSPLQRIPHIARVYRYCLPLFPSAIRAFDLRGYDIVLSSSHCVAKGVRVPSGTCHICYIHAPMRYVWDMYDEYFARDRAGFAERSAMRVLRSWLKEQDLSANRTVTAFIANSHNVAGKVKRFYGRDAHVIHAPVDWERFSVPSSEGDYYLVVSALVPYKRVEVAVEAFNLLKRRLKVIGTGPEASRLRARASVNVEFLGWQSDADLAATYASCRAVIFPGEEDFGIVPIEAMASGKPVIAYGRGGVLETVIPLTGTGITGQTGSGLGPTGVFFLEQTPEAIADAVRRFESSASAFDSGRIRQYARRFDRNVFRAKIRNFVGETYDAFYRSGDRLSA